jgi:hypothetical protein
MKTKGPLYFVVAGGLAFWLPAIVLSAIFHENLSLLLLNVASPLGLVVLAVTIALPILEVFRRRHRSEVAPEAV